MFKKSVFSMLMLLTFSMISVQAQKQFTRNGKVSFESDAPLEKIEANNNTAVSVLDTETGQIEFAVLIKSFQFEKALMQEHFNENYMESSKYPKATFKGNIVDISKVNFDKDGNYPVNVKGSLTIHGVTKEVETAGNIKINNGEVSADAGFEVAVADYKIEIPKVVRENIAKNVRISVSVDYKIFEKGL